MVEDSELDHDLLLATLRREGVAVQARRVQHVPQLAQALADGPWDAVVSDHQLPGFSSQVALDMVRAAQPYCPFIIVSGVMGEDAAVVAMRRGADDYLVKGRLARLVPSLLNAMAAADARREHASAREALERSEAQLRALLAQHETVIDEERLAMAREIHDDIGGALTALRLDMDWIGRHGDAASAARAAEAMSTLASVMDSALRLQQRLRPAILDQGMVAALRWLADDFGRRAPFEVRFRSNVEQATVGPATGLAAYRTVQEALTNVVKHAGATRVDVDLMVGPAELSLEIVDNGRGIADADRRKPTSFGLRGMAERAGRLGGWVDIGRLLGDGGHAGTVVLLSLPLGEAT
jgi:signal transduction histidine kinase